MKTGNFWGKLHYIAFTLYLTTARLSQQLENSGGTCLRGAIRATPTSRSRIMPQLSLIHISEPTRPEPI
eukprot:8017073-Pyramimonas_sp.AAC.1